MKRLWRSLLGLSATMMTLWVAACGTSPSETAARTVTVATSGGLLQDIGRETLWGPASKTLGIHIREQSFENGYQLLKLQSASGRVNLDVVELPAFLAARGYREGIVNALDYGVIDRSGFTSSTARPYCIGMLSASWVMGWNSKHFGSTVPATWADFWDVKRFPGRRGAHAGAEAQLEIALLADGVAPEDVYATLSRPDGLDRAIKKWAVLKPYISVWWNSGSQLAQLMNDGELDFAIGWNGRFEQVIAAGAPVQYTYRGGILEWDCWAVPSAAPHKALAMHLINDMVRAEPQARFSARIKYGPLNEQAFDTALIPPDVADRLPTWPGNLPGQLPESDVWWAVNSAAAERAFDDMRSR